MFGNHTPKSGSDSTSIGQDGQSKLLFLPDSARVRNASPLFKRRSLASILKQVNPAVDMRVVSDILYEAIYGHSSKALRVLYGVPETSSLRRVLADQSPLLYSTLKDAEMRLGIWIEATELAGGKTDLGSIYFDAGRVGRFCGSKAQVFANDMQLILKVEYDAMTGEISTVEDDEDVPF